MDMYHLLGNAFSGRVLLYLPVAKLIISLNWLYVAVRRVDGEREDWLEISIDGSILDVFFNVLIVFLSIYLLLSPLYIAYRPHLLFSPSYSCLM